MIMSADEREACGRCSMSVVVEATEQDETHNPFEDAHIEVSESELRTTLLPAVLLGRVKGWLNAVAMRTIYDH